MIKLCDNGHITGRKQCPLCGAAAHPATIKVTRQPLTKQHGALARQRIAAIEGTPRVIVEMSDE